MVSNRADPRWNRAAWLRGIVLVSLVILLTACTVAAGGSASTPPQEPAPEGPSEPAPEPPVPPEPAPEPPEPAPEPPEPAPEPPPSGGAEGLIDADVEIGPREDGSGAFRTHCLESHESRDDPLVYPGEPGVTHHHVFFGNPTVDAFTTSASLLAATTTTCDGGTLNRSAYWLPALFDANGERIEYVEPLFYYKTGYHVPAASIVPPPAGLQIIAGNAHAMTPQSTQVVKFRCGNWTTDEPQFDPGDPLDHVATIPPCEPDDFVEFRIVFPQCWDGVNLTAPDHRSHMAYPSEAVAPDVGTGACPDTHPVAIPEISYNVIAYVSEDRGDPQEWRFASDLDMPMDVAGGTTLHADWMNGWDADVMETIVEHCLHDALECMVGYLGDGTRLDPVVTD